MVILDIPTIFKSSNSKFPQTTQQIKRAFGRSHSLRFTSSVFRKNLISFLLFCAEVSLRGRSGRVFICLSACPDTWDLNLFAVERLRKTHSRQQRHASSGWEYRQPFRDAKITSNHRLRANRTIIDSAFNEALNHGQLQSWQASTYRLERETLRGSVNDS